LFGHANRISQSAIISVDIYGIPVYIRSNIYVLAYMNYRREGNHMSKKNITSLKPHISLNVANVEKSVEFYTRLLGMEPVKFIPGTKQGDGGTGRMGYAKFDVNDPPLNLVLNELPVSAGGSLSHLGIQVATTDDVMRTRARWIEAGLTTVDEMKVDCCYALQDKTWARDPDGNEWEVFVVLEDTQPQHEACSCGTKSEHAELSTEVCCTPGQKASTIGATAAPCC
jgi:catechol 2,3-dioxygenase-like lactoylglutathione lyase family enzyme